MSKSKKPWEEKWVKLEEKLGAGGQGTVWKVSNKSDPTGPQFALKLLNKQKDMERRKRFRREVVALETLQHTSIPKFIESNSHEYENLEIPLYFICEFIQGSTLETHIESNGTLELDKAFNLVDKLINVIDYCHSQGIVHRDLKIDNIILKGNDFLQPVILDFGISFNQAEIEQLTPFDDQLGNRFLELPELRTPGASKRDPRSDITSCVGILFFVLSGQIPRTLIDEKRCKPHRRERYHEWKVQCQLPSNQASALERLFDIGFEQEIAKRFQNIEQIRRSLQRVRESEKIEAGEDFLLELQGLRENQELLDGAEKRKITVQVTQCITAALKQIQATLPEHAVQIFQKADYYGLVRDKNQLVAGLSSNVWFDNGEVCVSLGGNEVWKSMMSSPEYGDLQKRIVAHLAKQVQAVFK